jgi:hypothetical protein
MDNREFVVKERGKSGNRENSRVTKRKSGERKKLDNRKDGKSDRELG